MPIGPAVQTVLTELKSALGILYGRRLVQLILYGSWARQDAGESSDIDVVVVLEGDVNPGREIDRMLDTLTELNLKHGVLLSIYPVDRAGFQTRRSPLLMNVRREGVAV